MENKGSTRYHHTCEQSYRLLNWTFGVWFWVLRNLELTVTLCMAFTALWAFIMKCSKTVKWINQMFELQENCQSTQRFHTGFKTFLNLQNWQLFHVSKLTVHFYLSAKEWVLYSLFSTNKATSTNLWACLSTWTSTMYNIGSNQRMLDTKFSENWQNVRLCDHLSAVGDEVRALSPFLTMTPAMQSSKSLQRDK